MPSALGKVRRGLYPAGVLCPFDVCLANAKGLAFCMALPHSCCPCEASFQCRLRRGDALMLFMLSDVCLANARANPVEGLLRVTHLHLTFAGQIHGCEIGYVVFHVATLGVVVKSSSEWDLMSEVM